MAKVYESDIEGQRIFPVGGGDVKSKVWPV